ncbi:uncharacterized protein LOC117782796 [Drosophila innubila]|uniref:uncharacterized protein LOC117782796 n=1 Tax=Drosophila innubila TaxID=198719 RepID=UPI00148DBEC6|nr:uncharacterized protein LOC117782796 [Drosophila innubila]
MERSHSCSNFIATTTVAQLKDEPTTLATSSDNLPQSCNNNNHSNNNNTMSQLPPNKPLRKRRKLQRQQLVIVDDVDPDLIMAMECECECAYAADLEENADPDVDDEVPRLMPAKHLPHPILSGNRCLRHEDSFDSSSTAPEMSPQAVRQHRFSSLLLRDSSISMQSDSSRYSSVDSLLESRKPDPEAILINLGFGPVGTDDMLSRIPKRFLKPSKVPGIDTEAFVKRLQLASSLADSSALGYRGLTSSTDQPPSSIVAKIMQRFEVNNQRKKSMGNIEHTIR